ncbi:CoA ester lyase [Moraxella sp. Pampa]|uniref:HpcH/HpaI aldolase/citrate lyase family protein n=1 Tax=Moraxella sp. Pampa TaxID=3111978 RepID=UPI002B410565|nr:CoA ester lyase [Moraxella sp. Pampa]
MILNFTAYLFVPAIRLDRVQKAFDGGADIVIIDLEDAVASAQKALARQDLADFDKITKRPYWLRINAAHTTDYAHDISLIKNLCHVQGVLLPKVESALSITALHQAIGLPIIAVVETAKGVLNIGEIATAKGLCAMTYGCLDLTKSLGMMLGTPSAKVVLDKIRMDLLLHSAINGLNPPIETIFADFHDGDGVANFAKYAQNFGFGGQLLIHPKQIGPVKNATKPNEDTLNLARQVLKTHQQTGQAVFSVQGKMVDLPMIEWAKKLLGD